MTLGAHEVNRTTLVKSIDFPKRTAQVLSRMPHVRSLEDLLEEGATGMRRYIGVGTLVLQEIKQTLDPLGLTQEFFRLPPYESIPIREIQKDARQYPKREEAPVLYFILCEAANAVKIGISDTAAMVSRLSTLQTGNPFPLVLLGCLKGDYRETEAKLHATFKEFRLRGEWFRYSDELKDFISQSRLWMPEQNEKP